VELVKQHPELRCWQLAELKKNVEAPKVSEVKQEKKEVEPVKVEAPKIEASKIEASKIEAPKVEEPVKAVSKVFVKEITDDDLYVSAINLSTEKKEDPKPISQIKIELPKPTKNILDEKEHEFKAKQNVLKELVSIAGPDNEYVDFVRKNYKLGLEQCLGLWFESHN